MTNDVLSIFGCRYCSRYAKFAAVISLYASKCLLNGPLNFGISCCPSFYLLVPDVRGIFFDPTPSLKLIYLWSLRVSSLTLSLFANLAAQYVLCQVNNGLAGTPSKCCSVSSIDHYQFIGCCPDCYQCCLILSVIDDAHYLTLALKSSAIIIPLRNVLLKSARYFCWEHFFKVSHLPTIGGEVSATDYPIHTYILPRQNGLPNGSLCEGDSCFLGITKSWSESCYGTLTSKEGPWKPIALPNAYTLNHILFFCLYVHQVLDMYDSHSFRSENQDIGPGYFWQWLLSLLPPLHILFQPLLCRLLLFSEGMLFSPK